MTFKRQPIWQYQNTSGIFKYFLPYSFLELVINLAVSIVAAIKWGLIGVFIGTTIAYIVSWLGQTYVVHKHVLGKGVGEYYIRQIKYAILTIVELLIIVIIKSHVVINNVWLNLFFLALLCLIIPNGINILLYKNTMEFDYLKTNLLGRVVNKVKEKRK